jgi:predicted  nucleic acid-binding Zn-ribbon protein
MRNILKNIIALIVFAVIIFIFRDRLSNQFFQLRNMIFPCKAPITYSIKTFDKRFGISEKDFLLAIKQAEAIWEKPTWLNLFEEKAGGDLKINLVYDDRQATTEKLKTIGVSVDSNRASYDAIKSKYEDLNAQYLKDKEVLQSMTTSYTEHQNSYNEQVNYWNRRKGAPKADYDALQLQKQSLQTELESLNQFRANLNSEVDNINALVATLNRQAAELNIDVARFNEVGSSSGQEFEEGLYKERPEGNSIDIYQYDSRAKLVRVLAHEFGHALGVGHLASPKDIMYEINKGTNLELSANDLGAVKNICKLK